MAEQQRAYEEQQRQEELHRQHQEQLRQEANARAEQAERQRRGQVREGGGQFFAAARAAVEAGGVGILPLKELREAFVKTPTYDEAKATTDFRQHLAELRKFAALWGVVAPVQRKLLLIFSIKGESALRVRHLDVDTVAYSDTGLYEEYEDLISEVFHPVSERNLARADFLAKKQAAEEDVSAYFSKKVSLFRLAVPGQETAEFPLLREELVAGLYSVPIKRAVWALNPRTVEDLHRAILEAVGQERIAFSRGFGTVTSLDGLLSVTGAHEVLRARRQQRLDRMHGRLDEPMEVNQLATDRRNPPPMRRFQGRCFACQKQGHIKADCPDRSRRGGGGGGSTNSRPRGDRRCFWCGQTGHMANNCSARRAGKPKVRVTQLEEEDEGQFAEMTEDEIVEYLAAEEAAADGGVNMLGGASFPRGSC